MIRAIFLPEYTQRKVNHIDEISDLPAPVWIDLYNPTEEELRSVEKKYNITFPTKQEQEEIEISSHYREEDGIVKINSTFITQQGSSLVENDITFICTEKLLFTLRYFDCRVLAETVKKVKQAPGHYTHPAKLLVTIIEMRIDLDADIIESLSKYIASLAKRITYNASPGEDVIIKINQYQEQVMGMRQVLFDKQRVVSFMLRNEYFIEKNMDLLKVVIKDINSLIEHTNFNFTRLEYMQDSFLALINVEQNKIIKRFTVASLVFMPPTLIASVYGMNFEVMPELEWYFGYPLAILFMLFSSVLALYFFKRKKWL